LTTEALKDALHISDLRVWAHVGVLDHERRDGQWFSLDLSMWLDLDDAARNDDLSRSADYSLAVQAVQSLANSLQCQTIEHFSERVLALLEELYGPVPMRVLLRKCAAPIPGFGGTVAVERHRHWTV
jgi:dihydroneopterin aldolase|tara:strand:- start:118 stop:498 length:381 start_codon:yes stop_codon:yes gene_type:complete